MKHNNFNHLLLMVVACGSAFLLIRVLPYFGLSKGLSAGIAMIVMFGMHVFMMKSHSNDGISKLKNRGD